MTPKEGHGLLPWGRNKKHFCSICGSGDHFGISCYNDQGSGWDLGIFFFSSYSPHWGNREQAGQRCRRRKEPPSTFSACQEGQKPLFGCHMSLGLHLRTVQALHVSWHTMSKRRGHRRPCEAFWPIFTLDWGEGEMWKDSICGLSISQ